MGLCPPSLFLASRHRCKLFCVSFLFFSAFVARDHSNGVHRLHREATNQLVMAGHSALIAIARVSLSRPALQAQAAQSQRAAAALLARCFLLSFCFGRHRLGDPAARRICGPADSFESAAIRPRPIGFDRPATLPLQRSDNSTNLSTPGGGGGEGRAEQRRRTDCQCQEAATAICAFCFRISRRFQPSFSVDAQL